jgi:CDP-diacylglycerol--glycerol-3-phosphate 3-phosphatidyltransferase
MSPGIFAHWPNRITALRFLGAVLLFILLERVGPPPVPGPGGLMQICFWLFLVTALSDFLDGYLARRGNRITAFGRIADPFVDKILVLGAMIYLAVLPWSQPFFPTWVVVVILAREILITAMRGYVESIGGAFPADWFGKLKMVAQCWAIGTVLGLYAFEWSELGFKYVRWLGHFFVWTTLLTSVGSGLFYIIRVRTLLTEHTR